MTVVVNHVELGEIVYEESFWTGKKKITLNRKELNKLDKKTFTDENGKRVAVKGNYLAGVSLEFDTAIVQLTPRIKWYEVVLSILPFLLIMVWGNTVALCKIVPVVGGAIGGGISGLMSCVSLYCIKGVKNIWFKIGIAILILGATFGICCGIGYAIEAAAS